nr:AMP-binding protein [Pseudodesulfovibrio sp.]
MTLSQNTLLIDGFIKNSSLYPDNKALYVDGIEYTYQMLANRIDSTSKRITQLDTHCKFIGVYAYRSIHMYTGILSALHSGNGYVPLNPIFPQSRVLAAIEKSGINITTDTGHLNEFLDMLGDQEQEFSIIVLEQPASFRNGYTKYYPFLFGQIRTGSHVKHVRMVN